MLEPGSRRYTIAVPHGYTDDEPVTLVLTLHYGGAVTPFYGEYVLTDLDDITPYQTGRFVDLLRAAVPWIKKA